MDQQVPQNVTDLSEEKLDELLALEKKNNKILKDMRNWARISFWFKVFIWIVVLAVPVILYSYFYPYIAPYMKILSQFGGGTASSTSMFGLPSPTEIQAFLHHGATTNP